jgi:hypothetical protein
MTEETKMNAALAIDAYSKNKRETISQEHLGYEVISAALNQLKTNLHILFSSDERKNRIKAFDFFRKAWTYPEVEISKNLCFGYMNFVG